MNYTNFKVDREYGVLEFSNDYWIPIQDFNYKLDDGTYQIISHLMEKNWFNDSLLNQVLLFLKSEFPENDYSETVRLKKQRLKDLREFFINYNKNNNNG